MGCVKLWGEGRVKRIRPCTLLLGFGLLAGFVTQSSAQNLVANPGFEALSNPIDPHAYCQADGWNVTNAICGTTAYFGTGRQHSGTFSLMIGNPSFAATTVSQPINLQSGKYDFSFWYSVVSAAPGGFMTASVGGQTFNIGAAIPTPFIQFDQRVTLAGGATTLAFTNGGGQYFSTSIDDVSLIFLGPLIPLLPPGAPVNAINVASSIDNFVNNGGNLPGLFQTLPNLSGAQLVSALLQLDGEAGTDAERGAFQLMNQFLGLMLDPFVDGRFGSGTSSFAPDRQGALPPDIAMAYASVLKAPPKVVDSGGVFGARDLAVAVAPAAIRRLAPAT